MLLVSSLKYRPHLGAVTADRLPTYQEDSAGVLPRMPALPSCPHTGYSPPAFPGNGA